VAEHIPSEIKQVVDANADRTLLNYCSYYAGSPVPVFTDLVDVQWRAVSFHRRVPDDEGYVLELPLPLANWDTLPSWELERIRSMKENLRYGDILYDVGTEMGYFNLFVANFVGPENLVLIEPTRQFWPNIRATWNRNRPGVSPMAFYDGLIGQVSNDDRTDFTAWPTCADGPLVDRVIYSHLHRDSASTPQLSFDSLVKRVQAVPKAITIDVEGAELLVLRSAERTLREHHPLVWVSVHPEFPTRDYGSADADVHEFMRNLGYCFRAFSHRSHWLYRPCCGMKPGNSSAIRDRADDRPNLEPQKPGAPMEFVTVTYCRRPGAGREGGRQPIAGPPGWGSLTTSPNNRIIH
jgi:FkbM family methyltransferase